MTSSSLKLEKVAPSASSAPVLPSLDIQHHELPNGLNILVQPDFSSPVVTIQYWCGTGSIHEGKLLGGGLSHLLEHLMFKGTPNMGNSQMAQRIQDLGGHMNAYTSFERTVYYVDLPAENWQTALELWTDAMQHSLIPAEEFEPEKDVIRREFAMGDDNPENVLNKLIFRSAFTTHPYRFPVIGHLDLFNQITRDEVYAYYRERYAPQNLTLILVGAVETAAVFAAAEKLWAKETRRWLPDPNIPDEPPQQSPRFIQKKFATEVVRLSLFYRTPGLGHPDIPALQILSMILGHGRSARLYRRLVEEEGLAEEIDAFAYAPSKVGLFGVDARCKPANHQKLVARIREELTCLRTQPPTAEELDRAKRLCLTQQMHQLKTMSGKAAAIGSGWMLTRDPHFNETFLHRLQQVTLENVAAVSDRYLLAGGETTVELVPNDYSLGLAVANQESIEPPLPQLVSKADQIKTIFFASHKIPLVSYRATLPGGMLHQPIGKGGLCRLTSQMLVKGTRKRTSEQLAREIEQLGGHLHSDSGHNSAALSLELLAQDWARGLDLFLEVLTEPNFTEKELATEKRKQLVSIQMEQDQPMAVCRDLLKGAFYGNHPYADSILGTRESVESITLSDVQEFARSIFQTSTAILGVAGPHSPNTWLDSLQSRLQGISRVALPPVKFSAPLLNFSQPIRVEKAIPKEQAIIQIAFPIPGVLHPDQVSLSLLHEALADLGTRLFVRIREQLGLAYFVSVSRFLGMDSGYFVFYAGTDPKRKRLVEEAILDEVRILAGDGLTSPELERSRAKLLSEDKIHSQNPAAVVAGATLDEYLGLGYHFNQTRQRLIKTTTLDEVNEVVKRYLQKEQYVVATVSPE